MVWGICAGLPAEGQPRVSAIEFRGLTRTQVKYLTPLLQTRRGDILDRSQVAGDEQSLHNLQLFASVSSHVEVVDDEAVVVFDLSERVTRIPITNFGGITENFWFQVGVTEYNWLGRGAHFGGYYQYYDRHSFKLFQQLPHLFSMRWGLSYTVGRQATREPAYFQSGTSDFDVDRWELTALVRHELYRNLRTHASVVIEAGGGYLHEIYGQRPGATFVYNGETDFDKYFLTSNITFERLNYFFHYLSGVRHRLTLQRVETVGLDNAFWKLLTEMRFYRRTGRRGNPAVRIRAGISTNDESPFVPFVLDSYLNVRGSGNRAARGTAEFTVNVEHRQTLIDRTRWAAQAILFVDRSSWRPAAAPLVQMFREENSVSFGGAGLRAHFKRIYNFTLRVDYGINLEDASSRGFVLGVGQYF